MTAQPATTELPSDKPKPVRRRKPSRRARTTASEPKGPKANAFAGISATKCCSGCTPERCVISTVNVCKHPFMTGDSGSGPITMANREAAKRIIKRQKADA